MIPMAAMFAIVDGDPPQGKPTHVNASSHRMCSDVLVICALAIDMPISYCETVTNPEQWSSGFQSFLR
tara:strand:+ start:1563 stop:1766 length:204 start_codon:yes stop_codon:yes gene_type:complete